MSDRAAAVVVTHWVLMASITLVSHLGSTAAQLFPAARKMSRTTEVQQGAAICTHTTSPLHGSRWAAWPTRTRSRNETESPASTILENWPLMKQRTYREDTNRQTCKLISTESVWVRSCDMSCDVLHLLRCLQLPLVFFCGFREDGAAGEVFTCRINCKTVSLSLMKNQRVGPGRQLEQSPAVHAEMLISGGGVLTLMMTCWTFYRMFVFWQQTSGSLVQVFYFPSFPSEGQDFISCQSLIQ